MGGRETDLAVRAVELVVAIQFGSYSSSNDAPTVAMRQEVTTIHGKRLVSTSQYIYNAPTVAMCQEVTELREKRLVSTSQYIYHDSFTSSSRVGGHSGLCNSRLLRNTLCLHTSYRPQLAHVSSTRIGASLSLCPRVPILEEGGHSRRPLQGTGMSAREMEFDPPRSAVHTSPEGRFLLVQPCCGRATCYSRHS